MLPLPLGQIVTLFSVGAQTIERYPDAGFDSEGNPTYGSATLVQISPANVQPVQGRELDQLPEGLRSQEVLWLFTTVTVRTTETHGAQADILRHKPGRDASYRRYRLHSAEDWTLQAGHFRCLCVRVAG